MIFNQLLSTLPHPQGQDLIFQQVLPLDNLENPFHSIDPNSSSGPTGPGPHHEMLSDSLFEGDLPRNKTSESNILAASKELVIESLSIMR